MGNRAGELGAGGETRTAANFPSPGRRESSRLSVGGVGVGDLETTLAGGRQGEAV